MDCRPGPRLYGRSRICDCARGAIEAKTQQGRIRRSHPLREEPMSNWKWQGRILGAVAFAAVLATGAIAQKAISIGTGGTGGVYYPLGGGLANVLSKYLPGGTQFTAEVTGGSVDNLALRSGDELEVVERAAGDLGGELRAARKILGQDFREAAA